MKKERKQGSLLKIILFFTTVLIAMQCGTVEEEEEDAVITESSSSSLATSSALSLNLLPELTDFLKSKISDFNLMAVNGTPPLFKTLKKSNAKEYISGDAATLKSELLAAKNANNWDLVETKVKEFQKNIAKCHIMEDAARQIKDISQQTTSLCIQKKIDNPTTSYLTYVSGTELQKGAFFMSGASNNVTRVLNIVEPTELTQEENGEGQEGGDGFNKLVSNVSGNEGEYKVTLNFCKDKTLLNQEIIKVNMTTKVLDFTHLGQHGNNKFDATLSMPMTASADGTKFEVDTSSKRTLTIKHLFSESFSEEGFSGKVEGTFNGKIIVEGDTLTVQAFDCHKMTSDQENSEGCHKAEHKVRYSATSQSDVTIFEGAGKSEGTFKGSFDGESFSDKFIESVAFEYDEDASIKYKNVTDHSYLTVIKAKDFAQDDFLKSKAPTDPDTSSLTDSVCDPASVASTYKLDITNQATGQAVQTIMEACDSGMDQQEGGSKMCEELRNIENEVMNSLHSCEDCEGKGDGEL